MKKLILVMVMIFMLFGIQSVVNAPEQPKKRVWTTEDSKAYAKDIVLEWQYNQYRCLELMWTKESNWRHEAYNKTKVMGKNAGGIPQLLGLSPLVPPTEQIERGFAYIMHRYGTPCKAWRFHKKHGWY